MSPLKGRKDESRKKKDVSYSVPNLNDPVKSHVRTEYRYSKLQLWLILDFDECSFKEMDCLG